MSEIKNKKALITGAASGIGKLMGKLLLQKGLHTLVIWDVNEPLLQTTVDEFTQQGFNVLPYVVNVMDTESVIATAAQVKKEVGIIDIFNNTNHFCFCKIIHKHLPDGCFPNNRLIGHLVIDGIFVIKFSQGFQLFIVESFHPFYN